MSFILHIRDVGLPPLCCVSCTSHTWCVCVYVVCGVELWDAVPSAKEAKNVEHIDYDDGNIIRRPKQHDRQNNVLCICWCCRHVHSSSLPSGRAIINFA